MNVVQFEHVYAGINLSEILILGNKNLIFDVLA